MSSSANTALRMGRYALPALAAMQCAPALTALGPLRTKLLPRLSGAGRPDHVALTFDDGPDPLSTPSSCAFWTPTASVPRSSSWAR